MKNDKTRTLEELEAQAEFAPICGGTVSSQGLQVCLDFRRQDGALSPKESKRLDELIELWRASLKRHNAQPIKVVEYNIETGEPI